MALQAVLTGDIVNSTRLTTAKEKKLLKGLKSLLASYKYEFYRGDSFQVYLKDAGNALRVALLCRAAAISIPADEELMHGDVRISIGLGSVKSPVKKLSSAKGEAFLLSGRMFDEITKSGKRLTIAINNPLVGTAVEVIADYLNSIFNVMTDKQAVVIFELLAGKTQKQVSDKLKKSKSTISQHVTAGRWYEVEKLLKQYESIIAQVK
ncbi:MAG: hypothetical protein JST09_12050 [Bacteroidetes bacterium]|nr:hypothetical protein [Bacteroidota bacterium]MBS1608132.1 hypothetical protein [Bacteroidota bacterium]